MEHKKNGDMGLAEDFHSLVKIARWNYIGIPFIDFLLPYFSKGILGASATEVGLLVSFTLLGVIIASAITGHYTTKFGSKRLMVVASFGRGSAYLIMYLAFIIGSVQFMMVGALLKGIFVGIFEVSYEVLIAEKSHKTQRSFAYGKVISSKGTVIFLGGAVGFSLYGILNSVTQYTALKLLPMLIFAGAMVGAGIRLKASINRESPKNSGETKDPVDNDEANEKIPNGSVNQPSSKIPLAYLLGAILLFSSLFLTSLNDSLTNPFIQVYLLEVLDSSFTVVLFAYSPGAIISYVLAPRFGKIADRINPYWGIAIVSIAGAALTWWLVNVTEIWMFSVIFLVDRGFALTGALMVKSIMSRLSIENRGKNLGYAWSIANVGGVIGPTIGGLLWDSYYPQMPFIVSIFVELGLIAFYLIGLRKTKNFMAEKIEENNE